MISGATHCLWRAVDQQGKVLANVVTKTRDLKSALKPFKKLMKRHGKPGSVVTDRFSFNGAALKDLGRGDDQEMGRCINNRVENRHLPFRRRYQAMLRFRRLQALQMFASGLIAACTSCLSERPFRRLLLLAKPDPYPYPQGSLHGIARHRQARRHAGDLHLSPRRQQAGRKLGHHRHPALAVHAGERCARLEQCP